MTAFRFIHAADIHLDSPLRGLAGQQGPAARRIRGAARNALENLIGLAIDEAVDFVVIAGDLYDGDWRDYQTGLFFVQQMGRLARAGIPVYLLHGNHDAENRITRRLTLPGNVRVFGARAPETFLIEELGVALHGQSFRQRDVTENLALGYPEPVKNCFNIGVLHTGLGGMGGHANYAPCTLADLVTKGYDYWALGHVHQHAVLNERPHVVFPGNLQGRHIREAGAKGACLVTVEDREIADCEHVPVDAVRWCHLQISAASCERLDDLTDQLRRAIESAVDREADGRLLACRVEISGRSPLHSQILSSVDQLLAEARAAALALGEDAAWIEKLRVNTKPVLDPQERAARADALGEMLSVLAEAAGDEAFSGMLQADIGLFVRRLPAEIRDNPEDPALKAAIDGDRLALIEAATAELRAKLRSEEA